MIFLSLSMEFFSLPLLYRVSPCTCNSNQQAVENWLPRKYAKHVLALWDTILQEGFLIMLNELRISGTFNSKITFPQNVTAFATPFIIVLSPFSGACGVEGGIFDWPLKPADSQWKGKIPLRLSHSSHNAKTAFHPLLHLPPLSKMADGWRVSVLFRLKKMIKRNSYLNLLCPGGGGGGGRKSNCFLDIQWLPALYAILFRPTLSLQIFSMKESKLVDQDAAKARGARKTATKGALSWSSRV